MWISFFKGVAPHTRVRSHDFFIGYLLAGQANPGFHADFTCLLSVWRAFGVSSGHRASDFAYALRRG